MEKVFQIHPAKHDEQHPHHQIYRFICQFGPFPYELWMNFSQKLKKVHLRPRQIFNEIDEIPQYLGFVESGVLRKYFNYSNGEEWTSGLSFSGSLTGDCSAWLGQKKAQAYVQALTDSVVHTVSYKDFQELTSQSLVWKRTIEKILLDYIERKEKKERSFLGLSAKEKLMAISEEFPELHDQIPQYIIASYLGITPVSLSRLQKKI